MHIDAISKVYLHNTTKKIMLCTVFGQVLSQEGSLQLRLYGGVRPHYWKVDPSTD